MSDHAATGDITLDQLVRAIREKYGRDDQARIVRAIMHHMLVDVGAGFTELPPMEPPGACPFYCVFAHGRDALFLQDVVGATARVIGTDVRVETYEANPEEL